MIENTEEHFDTSADAENFEGESQESDFIRNFNAEVPSVPDLLNNASIENPLNEDNIMNSDENLPSVQTLNGDSDIINTDEELIRVPISNEDSDVLNTDERLPSVQTLDKDGDINTNERLPISNEDSDILYTDDQLPSVPLLDGFQDNYDPVKLENPGNFEANADGRFVCPTCGKDFRDKSGLKGHMKRHSDVKPYACNICGKSFHKKSDVNRHEKTHSNEKPFPCDICNKSFANPRNLEHHKRTHEGLKPFSCEQCDQRFSEKSSLVTHQRRHTGEGLYYCDFCEKSFYKKSDLDRHRRVHTGEKPFNCEICFKSFPNRRNLTNHQRLHTGERPFVCDYCNKAFAVSGALKQHIKLHHYDGNGTFPCDVCQTQYHQRSVLVAHRKTQKHLDRLKKLTRKGFEKVLVVDGEPIKQEIKEEIDFGDNEAFIESDVKTENQDIQENEVIKSEPYSEDDNFINTSAITKPIEITQLQGHSDIHRDAMDIKEEEGMDIKEEVWDEDLNIQNHDGYLLSEALNSINNPVY